MKKTKFNFTESSLSGITPPPKDGRRLIYRDTGQKGLLLMITYGGTKTFYYCYKRNKRKRMLKIGQFPYTDIEQARERAFLFAKAVKNGKDPIAPEQPTSAMTLKVFFENEYIPKYAKQYKKQNTWQDNQQLFNYHFSRIGNRELDSFTKFEIDSLHKEIGTNRGHYGANRALALIRHIFNVAIDWGFIENNPAAKIKPYPEQARDRFLQPDEFNKFMDAINNQPDSLHKQLVLLLLYTGQRKGNIAALKWSNIDFTNNTLYLPETKNGEPQRIPLTNQAIDLLKVMRSKRRKNNDYLFPSDMTSTGHINTPITFWHKILKEAGLTNLRMHDLRRTMGSYQAITGSSLHIIGKSLGHKSSKATEVYARLNLDSVRSSMQKATDEMYKISHTSL
jgi:integrase